MIRAVVLSDTHMRPDRFRRLPGAVYDALTTADVVLHAGDVVTRDLLDELATFAPVHAVLGNNDHALVGLLPETKVVEFEGVTVGVIHDSGPSAGRAARLRRRFPAADLVVFGHSHAPCSEPGIEGQWLCNPGSPTERRAQPQHSFAIVEVAADAVQCELVSLDSEGRRT